MAYAGYLYGLKERIDWDSLTFSDLEKGILKLMNPEKTNGFCYKTLIWGSVCRILPKDYASGARVIG
jgi:hypothetical protein